MSPLARVDHLVVAARTLEQGVQWCEAALGVTPAPGGTHPLMGTHNRLLRVATAQYPRAYLEIIAIDPAAPHPGRRRWFDLDDPALKQCLQIEPRLIHFVASTVDAGAALQALQRAGIERGPLLALERASAGGLLSWQISVRSDGQRLFYGGLPTLIQWGPMHPASSLPESGLAVLSLHMNHPRPLDLRAAHAAIGLEGVTIGQGSPNLIATLSTARGVVTLESNGI